MSSNLRVFILSIICSFFLSVSPSYGSTAVDLFTKAMETLDYREADAYTKENSDKVAFEIDRALAKVTDKKMKKKERKFYFNLADVMTKSYTAATGDNSYLSKVKAKFFDFKLSEPFTPEKLITEHDIRLEEKKFTPDNIVIDVGDKVKWRNYGRKPHTIMSSLETGKRALLSKSMGKLDIYEFTFEEPGIYYYHSLVYKKIMGKITVLDVNAPMKPEDDYGDSEDELPIGAEESYDSGQEEQEEDVPMVRPGESDSEKQKRIDELLKKFDYNPDK